MLILEKDQTRHLSEIYSLILTSHVCAPLNCVITLLLNMTVQEE